MLTDEQLRLGYTLSFPFEGQTILFTVIEERISILCGLQGCIARDSLDLWFLCYWETGINTSITDFTINWLHFSEDIWPMNSVIGRVIEKILDNCVNERTAFLLISASDIIFSYFLFQLTFKLSLYVFVFDKDVDQTVQRKLC